MTAVTQQNDTRQGSNREQVIQVRLNTQREMKDSWKQSGGRRDNTRTEFTTKQDRNSNPYTYKLLKDI